MPGFKFDVKEWKVLNTEDIGKQKDNNSCGVHACLNADFMINLVDINVSEADLSAIRYWITLKAVQVQNTAKLRTNTKSFKKADVDYIVTIIRSIPCKKKKKGFSGTFAKIKILLGDRCCNTSAASDKEKIMKCQEQELQRLKNVAHDRTKQSLKQHFIDLSLL